MAGLRKANGSSIRCHTLRYDGVTAPFVLDGPMDGPYFLAYVEQILAPTLKKGRRGGSLRTNATPPPRTIWGKRTPPAMACRRTMPPA
jgi:hypothetical protein